MDAARKKASNLGLALIFLAMLELCWFAFCIFGGAVLGLVGFVDDEVGLLMWFLSGTYGLLAMVNLPIALLHGFAGTRLRQGKGLMLAMAALATCMIQLVLALYCFPFEIGVLIYGLVVLADEDVRTLLDSER